MEEAHERSRGIRGGGVTRGIKGGRVSRGSRSSVQELQGQGHG